MRDTLVILAAIALIATSAQALDVNSSVIYSGAGNTETNLNIGVASAGSVTVSAGGDLTVGTGLGSAGMIRVSTGAAGSLHVQAGATLTADGNWYNPIEGESASLVVGGGPLATAATMVVGAGAVINAKAGIYFGMTNDWNGGVDADVTLGDGVIINAGLEGTSTKGNIGIAGAGGSGTIVRTKNLTINGNARLFFVDGTIEVEGTFAYNVNTGTGPWSMPGWSSATKILKMKGAGAVITTGLNGAQLGKGLVDISELPMPLWTWTTIMTHTKTWDNFVYDPLKFMLNPATSDPGWQMKSTFDAVNGGGTLEVMIPEPATMALLAIGGIGALLRKRR